MASRVFLAGATRRKLAVSSRHEGHVTRLGAFLSLAAALTCNKKLLEHITFRRRRNVSSAVGACSFRVNRAEVKYLRLPANAPLSTGGHSECARGNGMTEQRLQSDTEEERDRRGGRRWRLRMPDVKAEWTVGGGLKLAGGGLAGALIVVAVWWFTQHQRVEVPNLLGLTRAAAEVQLRDKGLTLRATRAEPSDQPDGTVIRTDPAPGSEVDKGSAVSLVLASHSSAAPSPQPSPSTTLSVAPPPAPVPPATGGGNRPPVHNAATTGRTTTTAITAIPSRAQPPSQPVHIRNDLVLGRYQWIDLDTGAYNPGNGGDLYFGEDANTQAFHLQPMSPATAANAGVAEQRYATCASPRTTADMIPLTQLPANSIVCVRTDEGRVSAVKITGTSDGPNGRDLHVTYVTWER